MTAARPTLLVVDDETAVLSLIRRVGEDEGFDVVTCMNAQQALQMAQAQRPDLVMVDLRMPDVNGLDVVRALRDAEPSVTIVLMTGFGSIDSAVEAVKRGAADYLTKPFDLQRLRDTFAAVRDEAERRARIMAVDQEMARRAEFAGMIGRSAAMQGVFDLIRRLAPHVRSALIVGETGTGKELVARALHQCGPRKARRFVAVNCSAVVETLFESELFGHVRGAFTGATEAKPGLFETADGGTLFLDEIGELPLHLQAKLLRVLETGEVQRVGAVKPVRTDVRLVCATNRDLHTEAHRGQFRTDLLFRLNVVQIALPSLRDRREDIPYLTAAFVREFGERFGCPTTSVSLAAERMLQDAPWPGNIRQLRNVLERACMLAEGAVITEQTIASSLCPTTHAGRPQAWTPSCESGRGDAAPTLESLERHHIMKVIADTGGNKTRAARELGLSRRALYRRLERHEISKSSSRPRPTDDLSGSDR